MNEINFNSLKKMYYTIGEVAKLFDVNTSLIRFWEKEFDFEASKKTPKGNRLYSVKDLEKFNKIYHLVKLEGYTLDGAKKMLKTNTKNPMSSKNNFEIKELIIKLEQIKSKLIELKSK